MVRTVDVAIGYVVGAAIATPADIVWKSVLDANGRVSSKGNKQPFLNGAMVISTVGGREEYALLKIAREGNDLVSAADQTIARKLRPTLDGNNPLHTACFGAKYVSLNLPLKDGDKIVAQAVDVATTAILAVVLFITYGGPAARNPNFPLEVLGDHKVIEFTNSTAADVATTWGAGGVEARAQGELVETLKEKPNWNICGWQCVPEDHLAFFRIKQNFEDSIQPAFPPGNYVNFPILLGTINRTTLITPESIGQAATEIEAEIIVC